MMTVNPRARGSATPATNHREEFMASTESTDIQTDIQITDKETIIEFHGLTPRGKRWLWQQLDPVDCVEHSDLWKLDDAQTGDYLIRAAEHDGLSVRLSVAAQ
jgi:hypothetical protein